MTEDAQQYVDDMARTRGYVLEYHKKMAKQDFPVLQAANGLVSAALPPLPDVAAGEHAVPVRRRAYLRAGVCSSVRASSRSSRRRS